MEVKKNKNGIVYSHTLQEIKYSDTSYTNSLYKLIKDIMKTDTEDTIEYNTLNYFMKSNKRQNLPLPIRTVVVEEGFGYEKLTYILWTLLILALIMILYLIIRNMQYKKQELKAINERATLIQDSDMNTSKNSSTNVSYLKAAYLVNEKFYEGEYAQGDRSNPFGNLNLTKGILLDKEEAKVIQEEKKLDEAYLKLERYLENNKYKTKYEEIKMLGKGGFAEVYTARYILDGNIYAIKKVPVGLEEDEDLKQHHAYREIEAMTRLSHQNIVRYMTCWIEKGEEISVERMKEKSEVVSNYMSHSDLRTSEVQIEWDRGSEIKESHHSTKQEVIKSIKPLNRKCKIPLVFFIQMEYCAGSSLKDWIEKGEAEANPKLSAKYFTQIIKALKAIHSNGLIHRDMKPANVFLDRKGNLKVGDFGLAVLQLNKETTIKTACGTRSVSTTKAGTKLYLSPEQLAEKVYDEKIDIYSTGLILLELSHKFETTHERIAVFSKLKEERKLPKKLQKKPEADLILKMTEKEPVNRPSAEMVFELPCYKEWIRTLEL